MNTLFSKEQNKTKRNRCKKNRLRFHDPYDHVHQRKMEHERKIEEDRRKVLFFIPEL
jgi:hypothetical protein